METLLLGKVMGLRLPKGTGSRNGQGWLLTGPSRRGLAHQMEIREIKAAAMLKKQTVRDRTLPSGREKGVHSGWWAKQEHVNPRDCNSPADWWVAGYLPEGSQAVRAAEDRSREPGRQALEKGIRARRSWETQQSSEGTAALLKSNKHHSAGRWGNHFPVNEQ